MFVLFVRKLVEVLHYPEVNKDTSESRENMEPRGKV
jgi:hypothetical protein